MGRLAVVLIRGYQRYLSPYKGYSCARRLRLGGDSCSEYARLVFADDDGRTAWKKLVTRFRECQAARRALQAERLHQRDRDEYFDHPPGDVGKTPAESPPTPRRSGECLSDPATVECCCSPGLEAVFYVATNSLCG